MKKEITHEQKQLIELMVETCVDRINKFWDNYGKPEVHIPMVYYTVRGTTGGRAIYESNKIDLNPVLVAENFERYLSQTIPHEVSHLASYKIHGIRHGRGHGKAWKHMMEIVLGVKADRCHNMNVTNSMVRNTRKFNYTCGCFDKHYVGVKVHKKAQSGYKYICGKCKTMIEFTGIETTKRALAMGKAPNV